MNGRALGVAVLLAALVAGCGGKSLSATQIVAQSAAKTGKLTSFHLVVDIENVPASKTGISLTFVDGDVAVPDKVQARVAGTLLGVPLQSELIVIGKRHYLKDPFSGKWQLAPISMTAIAFFDPTKGVLAVVEGASGLAKAGSEDVDGVSTYRLTGKVRAATLTPLLGNPASATLLPVELWIGKHDLLLRRVRLSGPISASDGKTAVRTVDLSGFDRPVSISPPAGH